MGCLRNNKIFWIDLSSEWSGIENMTKEWILNLLLSDPASEAVPNM